MEKYYGVHQYLYRTVFITIVVMLMVIGLSVTMAFRISSFEEQEGWNVMEQTAQSISDELSDMVANDQELLESIATIIEGMSSIDSPEVQKIIDEFSPNTMISHIALLLPGDMVMIPNEPIRSAKGILSFEKEASLGNHISDRSVDVRDTERYLLRSFVPVEKNGEVIALLYGVVDLKTLPEQLERNDYEGKIQINVINAVNGDYIIDTWHDTLGNLSDYEERQVVSGEKPTVLIQKAMEGESGYSVFVSKSIGENLYFYSMPSQINNWVVGIHVPESLVFRKMHKVNRLLILFIGAEIFVLAGYFFWILFVTRKEINEQKRIANFDVLTGLLNRNCYEKNIHAFPAECRENLTCIYTDANGLHELNNSKGHEAGDIMLKEVAQTIQNTFGEKQTFRIGGDEFVAFAVDEKEEVIQLKVDEIIQYLSSKGYSVSVGMASQNNPIDVDTLTKQAETRMYEAKKQHYETTGNGIRTR